MNKIMKTLSLMFAVGAMLFSSGLHHEDAKVAKAAALGDSYSKVTDISTLNNDDNVVIYCDDNSVGVTGANGNKDATVDSDSSKWIKYVVTVVSGGVNLYDSSADKYIAKPTTNHFKYATSPGVCSVDSNGVLKCNDRYLYANDSLYRMYEDKSSYDNYKPFYVYKVLKTIENISFIDSNNQSFDTLNLNVNDMYDDFTVSYTPTDASNTTINWTSSNSEVAEYDDGCIYAYSAGEATITATAAAGGANASIKVYVTEEGAPQLTGVTVSGNVKTPQYVGNDFDYSGLSFTPIYDIANDSPETITGDDIIWPTLTSGMTSITGKYKNIDVVVNGLEVKDDSITSISITGDMTKKTYAETQSFSSEGLIVTANYESGATEDITNKEELTWSFSITPSELGVGESKSVIATATYNSKTASKTVIGITITEAPDVGTALFDFTNNDNTHLSASALAANASTIDGISLSVNKNSSSNDPTTDLPVRMYKGFKISILADDSIKSITKISVETDTSNSKYPASNLSEGTWTPSAEINLKNSIVTASFEDTKEVTIVLSKGQSRWNTLTVEYEKEKTSENVKVETIEVSPSTNEIEINKTCQLSANVLPVNAFDKTVTWSSDNNNIASVDSTGKVTGVSIGTTIIKATANDGSGIYGSATINVVASPSINYEANGKEDLVNNSITTTGADLFVTKIGSDTTGWENNRGLKFSKNGEGIIVNLETIGHSISMNGNKIIINAATTSNGVGTAKLAVYVGNTQIGEETSLTATSTDYTFTSPAETELNGVLKIVLSVADGAVYLKSLKAYGIVTKLSEDVTNLNKLIAEMKVKNTCTDYNDSVELREQYNALSDESKAIFDSTVITDAYEKDENIEAGITVKLSDKLAYMELLKAENEQPSSSLNLFSNNNSNNLALILIIGLLGLSSIASYYFLNKKKYSH